MASKEPDPVQSMNSSSEKPTNDGQVSDSSETPSQAETPAELPETISPGSEDRPANAADGTNPGDGSRGNAGVAPSSEVVETEEIEQTSGYDWNDEKDRKAAARRATRLRTGGVALRDADVAFLAEYDANKRKPGRKPKSQPASGIGTSPGDGRMSVPNVPGVSAVAPQRSRRSLSPPPVIHSNDDDDWKSKYGGKALGREMLCITVADAIVGTLSAMEKQIAEAGIDPWVDVSSDKARAMFILAVDEVLPANIVASPAIIGTFKMTAITTQRFWHRNAIATAKKRKTNLVSVMPMMTPLPPTPPPAERAESRVADDEPMRKPEPKAKPSLTIVDDKVDDNVVR
jgi:hypothetical protein